MSVEVDYSKYISRYKNLVEDIARDSIIKELNEAFARYFGGIPILDNTPEEIHERIRKVLKARCLTWIYLVNDKVILERVPPELEGRISMKELSEIILGTYIEEEDCIVISWDNFVAFIDKKINRISGLMGI